MLQALFMNSIIPKSWNEDNLSKISEPATQSNVMSEIILSTKGWDACISGDLTACFYSNGQLQSYFSVLLHTSQTYKSFFWGENG